MWTRKLGKTNTTSSRRNKNCCFCIRKKKKKKKNAAFVLQYIYLYRGMLAHTILNNINNSNVLKA